MGSTIQAGAIITKKMTDMKTIRILVLIGFISIFGMQFTQAQQTKNAQIEQKLSTDETPAKVKEVLKKYSRYTISKEATVQKKSGNKKVYTFKIVKGNWTKYLLIDQKGKVLGVRSDES